MDLLKLLDGEDMFLMSQPELIDQAWGLEFFPRQQQVGQGVTAWSTFTHSNIYKRAPCKATQFKPQML